MKVGGKCDRLVVKYKSKHGYKVYKKKDAAEKAEAQRCGGTVRIESSYEYPYRPYDYGCGTTSEFSGFEVSCNKCGHIYARYDLVDAEQAVEEMHNTLGDS